MLVGAGAALAVARRARLLFATSELTTEALRPSAFFCQLRSCATPFLGQVMLERVFGPRWLPQMRRKTRPMLPPPTAPTTAAICIAGLPLVLAAAGCSVVPLSSLVAAVGAAALG